MKILLYCMVRMNLLLLLVLVCPVSVDVFLSVFFWVAEHWQRQQNSKITKGLEHTYMCVCVIIDRQTLKTSTQRSKHALLPTRINFP